MSAIEAQGEGGRWRWIVSPRFDLGFFVLSCALTFCFYMLYELLRGWGYLANSHSVLLTYFIFTAVFDQPHIFQMFSRTHLDRVEFERHRVLYTWGLAGFIAAGVVVEVLGLREEMIIFTAYFGSWHIIRQHSGFMKAYKRLNNDNEPIDDLLDDWVLYVGMISCMLHGYSDLAGPIHIFGELSAPFPSLPASLGWAGVRLFCVVLVLYVGRQCWRLWRGEGVNLPKLLLLTAALSTHWFVFFFAAVPFLVAEALETAYHDVQYHGWMIHYQRRRFAKRRIAAKWMGAALLYGGIVGAVEIFDLLYYEDWGFIFTPFAMIVLYHYYVDGKIWRFSEDPELRAQLFGRPATGGEHEGT